MAPPMSAHRDRATEAQEPDRSNTSEAYEIGHSRIIVEDWSERRARIERPDTTEWAILDPETLDALEEVSADG